MIIESRASSRSAEVDAVVERGRRAGAWLKERFPQARIYTGGAPLAGLGSPFSDIDIFVVLNDDQSRLDEQLDFEGERLDVEHITLKNLSTAIDECSEFRFSRDDRRQMAFASRARLDHLTRFALGEILADDHVLETLQRQLGRAVDEFTKLLVARHCVDGANLAEDIAGALANGDASSADYLAREQLYRSAEAYLCSKGDRYIGTKWLWARWERTVGDDLGAEVRSSIHREPGEPSGLDRTRRLAQDLAVMASTGHDYHPTAKPHPGTWARRADTVVVPTREGALLLTPGRDDVAVSWQGALLWGLAHGRTMEQTTALMGEALLKAGESATGEEIAEYCHDLAGYGVMDLR
ncbi:nucleotidyltransferase domain-containing protein [Streptosporangium sp. NPDC020072]|uniref:nucleotidyltransferase domain-containing protein n=1 Tax=Streptosporangium sp. NPDC020072 TaxID=3154788 RepID=UPI003419C43B